MTQATIIVRRSMRAYIILADVEFLQDGHDAQHKLQAADPQQQAKLPKDIIPPILGWLCYVCIAQMETSKYLQ